MEYRLQHKDNPHSHSSTSLVDQAVPFVASVDPVRAALTCSDRASELNNKAVSLLQDGKGDEAEEMFCQAWMDQAQSSVFGQQNTSLNSENASALSPPILVLAPVIQQLNVILPIPTILFECLRPSISSISTEGNASLVGVADDRDLFASPSNYFALYSRGFIFTNERSDSLDLNRRIRLLPAVILYNVGLMHLRRALQQVTNQEYEIAYRYFTLALGIAEDNAKYLLYSADYNLLQLALYNNLGFISSHFFNEHEALICAGRMLATFASMDCTRLLIKEEYVFYYMNLLFLLNRHPILAPAA